MNAATPRERLNDALLRAKAQTNHFAASSSNATEVFCERCRLPLNRWQEPCQYAKTAAALLAEDVIWLAKQIGEPRDA